MNLDFLKLRRPALDYISPPICEVIFSATGVVIILEPFGRGSPTGLALGGPGGRDLVWDTFRDSICYDVYRLNEVTGDYDLISECVPDPVFPNPPRGCYRVSAITPEGESDLSQPFCFNRVAVTTEPATDIQTTSAILNGIANPDSLPGNMFFEWGVDLNYGTLTAPQSAVLGAFDDLITGLDTNTTYHFRALLSGAYGIVAGQDRQFTTPGGDDIPCGTGIDVHILNYTPDMFDNPPPSVDALAVCDVDISFVNVGDNNFGWFSNQAAYPPPGYTGTGYLNMFGIWWGGLHTDGGTTVQNASITDLCPDITGSPAVGHYAGQTIYSNRSYEDFPVWSGHFPLTNANENTDPLGNLYCAEYDFAPPGQPTHPSCETIDGYPVTSLTLAHDPIGEVWTLTIVNYSGDPTDILWQGTRNSILGAYARIAGTSLIPAIVTLTI